MELQNQIKQCERCGNPFECKPLHISECQCANIHLTEKAQAFIQSHFNNCLCKECLLEINQMQKDTHHLSLPRSW